MHLSRFALLLLLVLLSCESDAERQEVLNHRDDTAGSLAGASAGAAQSSEEPSGGQGSMGGSDATIGTGSGTGASTLSGAGSGAAPGATGGRGGGDGLGGGGDASDGGQENASGGQENASGGAPSGDGGTENTGGRQSSGGSASADGGSGGLPLHTCLAFVDRSATDDSRTILWNFDLPPERCMLVQAGQSVTWTGNFQFHPLSAWGGDLESPIGTSSAQEPTHEVQFGSPGTFGYICEQHTEMRGAIQVVP